MKASGSPVTFLVILKDLLRQIFIAERKIRTGVFTVSLDGTKENIKPKIR